MKTLFLAAVFLGGDSQALSCGWDGQLLKWDLATGQRVASLARTNTSFFALAASPDGKLALAGDADHMLRLYNAVSGAELATVSTHKSAVRHIAFSAAGDKAVSTSENGWIIVWRIP
jgi:WD40 repeat protein